MEKEQLTKAEKRGNIVALFMFFGWLVLSVAWLLCHNYNELIPTVVLSTIIYFIVSGSLAVWSFRKLK